MEGITAREILDTAITLEEGQKIVTQCSSFNKMETLRTKLYKGRKSLLKTSEAVADSLYISRKIEGNNFFVIIEKEISMTVGNITIVDKDGNVKPFTRAEEMGGV